MLAQCLLGRFASRGAGRRDADGLTLTDGRADARARWGGFSAWPLPRLAHTSIGCRTLAVFSKTSRQRGLSLGLDVEPSSDAALPGQASRGAVMRGAFPRGWSFPVTEASVTCWVRVRYKIRQTTPTGCVRTNPRGDPRRLQGTCRSCATQRLGIAPSSNQAGSNRKTLRGGRSTSTDGNGRSSARQTEACSSQSPGAQGTSGVCFAP